MTVTMSASRASRCDVRMHASRFVDGWQLTAYAWPTAARAAPCVAFVNGMEERWDFCAEAARALTPHYRTFSLELPWSGNQGNRWSATRDAAEWLNTALDLLPSGPAVLVAHSFGANALLSYVDRYGAGRVSGAVLLAPFYRLHEEAFDWELFHHYVDEFQRLLHSSLDARAETARLSLDLKTAMAARVRERIGPCGWLQFFDLFSRTPDLRIERLQFPCLVVGGETDFASRPEDCRALAAGLPAGMVRILPGCGHFCLSEQPDAVASTITSFISQQFTIADKGVIR